MDKRSIIFVLALTLALFGVQIWFAPKEQPASAQTTQVDGNEAAKAEIQKRTAPLSELPIISLYNDPQGTQVATLAVKDNQQYLTFAWVTPAPTTLYVKNGKKMDAVALRAKDSSPQAPLLYSSSTTEPLRVVNLPPNESFDLQLVSFSGDNQRASVTLGEVENQQILIPLEKPQAPAIALYKSSDEYLPYAFYNPSSFRLTLVNDLPNLSSLVQVSQPEVTAPAGEEGEQFYVLENAYQQLVFSNLGGALCEINLPIKSDAHPNSVVREIDFDRILQEQYPQTDYFPNSGYYIVKEQGGAPALVEKRNLGDYYPLIRRSIVGSGGKLATRVPPRYYACNILSGDQKDADLKYKLKSFGKNFIEFEASQSQRRISKRFSLPADSKAAPYCFDLTIKVDGDARDLNITSGVPEVELTSGSSSPALKYRVQNNSKPKVEQISLPKNSQAFSSFRPDWICNSNGFLGLILDPLTEIENGFSAHKVPGEFIPTRLTVIDAEYQLYPADKYPGFEMLLPLKNTTQPQSFRIFAGPFASSVLKTVDKTYSDPATHYNPDYISSQSFHGWFAFISEPFAKFLFFLMNIFHAITRSWGVSIILLTLALRIMLYPLNAWSIKSTAKMQEVAPLVAAIQEKHKKDPKRGQLEVVALYKEKGVNPFSGCLPILIQLPFLIGMFDLLKSTFELRGASFIPYWIDNLTAPDVVFSWNYPIIFFGTNFHLLPILIGLVMYWQQKISSPAPVDKNQMTDQQKQQKMMGNIMVIVFTVMFYHFPSGLNIYWLFSILFGILQQWLVTKKRAASTGKVQPFKKV